MYTQLCLVVAAAHFCILQSICVMYTRLCLCCGCCAFLYIAVYLCDVYAVVPCCGGCAFLYIAVYLCDVCAVVPCCGCCAFCILQSMRVMYAQFADGCHYRHCRDDFLYEWNCILWAYLDSYGYPYEYLESGGGYLFGSSCRYLFSVVLPVLPCRSVPYQIEEFVPCPFVFQKHS